jgi:hypothetical protein
MAAACARVEVAALQALLTVLGVLMRLASGRVDRFRRQGSRDLLLEIRSADGARQQYRLHAATRRLTLPRRAVERADCSLIFPTAREGLRALISPRAIGRIVEGMNTGGTRIEGNPVLLLWFHGLTRIVAPIGRTRRPRRPGPVPVRAREGDAPWARRIIREPPVSELSRDWPQAWAAREKLLQVRAAAEPVPPRVGARSKAGPRSVTATAPFAWKAPACAKRPLRCAPRGLMARRNDARCQRTRRRQVLDQRCGRLRAD